MYYPQCSFFFEAQIFLLAFSLALFLGFLSCSLSFSCYCSTLMSTIFFVVGESVRCVSISGNHRWSIVSGVWFSSLFCFHFFCIGYRIDAKVCFQSQCIVLSEAKLPKNGKKWMNREKCIRDIMKVESNKSALAYIYIEWHFLDEFLNSCNQRSGRIKLVNLFDQKCMRAYTLSKYTVLFAIGFGV